ADPRLAGRSFRREQVLEGARRADPQPLGEQLHPRLGSEADGPAHPALPEAGARRGKLEARGQDLAVHADRERPPRTVPPAEEARALPDRVAHPPRERAVARGALEDDLGPAPAARRGAPPPGRGPPPAP